MLLLIMGFICSVDVFDGVAAGWTITDVNDGVCGIGINGTGGIRGGALFVIRIQDI